MPILKRAERAPRQPKKHEPTREPITAKQLADAENEARKQIAIRVYADCLDDVERIRIKAARSLYRLAGDFDERAPHEFQEVCYLLVNETILEHSREHAAIREHERARRGEDLRRATRRILVERGATGHQIAALDDPGAPSAALSDTAARKAANRDRENLRQDWQAELGKARRRLARIENGEEKFGGFACHFRQPALDSTRAKIVDLERRLRDLDSSSEK